MPDSLTDPIPETTDLTITPAGPDPRPAIDPTVGTLPVPTRKGRVVMEARHKQLFLEHYLQWGVKNHAARACGVSIKSIYNNMASDPEFKEQVEQTYQLYVEGLMLEARRRAVDGVEEPLYYQGLKTGHTVVRRSDRLLERLLEAQAPGFSKKVDVEHTHKGGVMVVHGDVNSEADWRAKHGGSKAIDAEVVDVVDGGKGDDVRDVRDVCDVCGDVRVIDDVCNDGDG